MFCVVLNRELSTVLASADIEILHLMYRFCDALSVCRIDTVQPVLEVTRISANRIRMCSAPNSLIRSDCRDSNTSVRVAPCTPVCKASARTKFQRDFIRALRAGGLSRTFRFEGLRNVNN